MNMNAEKYSQLRVLIGLVNRCGNITNNLMQSGRGELYFPYYLMNIKYIAS